MLENLILRERHDKILMAVDTLPELHKEIVTLKYGLDGNKPHTYVEIRNKIVKIGKDGNEGKFACSYLSRIGKESLNKINREMLKNNKVESRDSGMKLENK